MTDGTTSPHEPFGEAALDRTRFTIDTQMAGSTRRSGLSFPATIGVLLLLLALGVTAGVIGRNILDEQTSDDAGPVVAAPDSIPYPPFEFEVTDLGPAGTCLTGALRQISCAEPHTSEVLVVVVASGEEYPGPKPLQASAMAGCGPAMGQIPRPTEMAPQNVLVAQPSRSAWERGVREIACLVVEPDGDLHTGSVIAGDRIETVD